MSLLYSRIQPNSFTYILRVVTSAKESVGRIDVARYAVADAMMIAQAILLSDLESSHPSLTSRNNLRGIIEVVHPAGVSLYFSA